MEECDDFGNGSEMEWNGQVPKSGSSLLAIEDDFRMFTIKI